MTNTKQLSIPVGFQWRNASGKEWVVTGTRPGGVCEIRQVGCLVMGKTYARCIREQIAAGTVKLMETSEEARAILRRCNGR